MKNICTLAFLTALLLCGPVARVACAADAAAPIQTIATEEVWDAGDEAVPQKVSLARVEASRRVTSGRLYGLVGFWLLIALVIYLIRFQVRDDEKLYQEGYYNKDLE